LSIRALVSAKLAGLSKMVQLGLQHFQRPARPQSRSTTDDIKSGELRRNISLKFPFDRRWPDRFPIASIAGTSHGQTLMKFPSWRDAARLQSGGEKRTMAHPPDFLLFLRNFAG
jgi:hypothetical protein